jgi:predicted nucleotidyltransferase
VEPSTDPSDVRVARSEAVALSGLKAEDNQSSSRLQQYLDAVAQLHCGVNSLVSVILFGSAASGAVSESSDVDLIMVLTDGATAEDRRRIRVAISVLEISHGLRLPASRRKNPLERFAEHAGGDAHSCFLCTRADLLSGDVARVFGLRAVEELFVDRIVLASVVVSAKTVWGEELLPRVPLPPLRRFDVFKALFGFAGLTLLSAVAFPVLSDATRYAMGALKHSLHSCYFCYHLKTAPLNEEVEFFNSRLGGSSTLLELLNQRRKYHRTFAFVLRCVPVLFRLHLRTAWDNRFPRAVVREGISG